MEIANSDWLLGGEMDMECDLIHSEHKPRSRGFIQAGILKIDFWCCVDSWIQARRGFKISISDLPDTPASRQGSLKSHFCGSNRNPCFHAEVSKILISLHGSLNSNWNWDSCPQGGEEAGDWSATHRAANWTSGRLCLEKNSPFDKLDIADTSALENFRERQNCANCNRSRKFFCYSCCRALPSIEKHTPFLTLPVR